MEAGETRIVVLKGHDYYVVDQELSKGDRRSDGPALSNFFDVEEECTSDNNVRESRRVKKRRDMAHTANLLQEDSFTGTILNHDPGERPIRKKKVQIRM
jgi:hypothetical protein